MPRQPRKRPGFPGTLGDYLVLRPTENVRCTIMEALRALESFSRNKRKHFKALKGILRAL